MSLASNHLQTLKPTFTQTLARRCVDFSPTADDLIKAKLCILDFLSCALTGGQLPWSEQAKELAEHAGGSSCSVIGSSIRATAGDAAFANAVLGHSLVRDDMHLGSVSHLGTVIIPTLLALSQTQPVSGYDFLRALAVGYEAGGTLGRAVLDVEVSKIFRPTGITGPVGAAAAGAVLLHLNAEQTTHALGIASNAAAGYNEWAATGGSEMFFHAGFAARSALTALALGKSGASASLTAVDGRAGVLAAFNKLANSHAAAEPLETSEIQAVFFKEVPACNFAQSAAQAAHALAVTHAPKFEDIASVTAHINYASAHYPGCNNPGPLDSILQAKMSIQYNVAAALLTGDFSEPNYVPSQQGQISQLAQKVRLSIDPRLTARFPAQQSARVEISLANGQTLAHAMDDVRGASEELVRKRFSSAASAALNGAKAERLLELVANFEQSEAAGALADLCATSNE